MKKLLLLLALLIVSSPAHAQVVRDTLKWTAPGDDGAVGTATVYDMRYSTTRPDSSSQSSMLAWWNAANVIAGLPAPLVGGTKQSTVVAPVGGFMLGPTYYFVLRTADEIPNWSGYSNVAWRSWPAPDVIPPAAVTDLH